MKHIIYFLGFTFLLISCQSPERTAKDNVIPIEFSKNEKVEPKSVLSTSFVKLQTNEDCLLGGVDQAEEYNGRYFLLDFYVSRTLYAFDNKGTFISSIGKRGNGPGEYNGPFSFCINKERGIIHIVDLDLQKVINYSLKDYQYLSEKQLPFACFAMEYLPNGDIAWYNGEADTENPIKNVILTDETMNIKKEMMEQEFSSGYKIGMVRKLYKQNNVVSAYSHLHPLLFRIENDTIIPAYQFSFGNHQLAPVDFLKKEGADNRNYIPALKASPYVYFYEVYENNKLLCVPYFVDNTMFFGFYDKQNSKVYNYKQDELQQSLSIGAFSSPVGMTSDNKFISLLRPGLLKELREEGMNLDGRLNSLIAQSDTEDNPILLLFW